MSTINSYSGNHFDTNYKIAIIASEFNNEVVDILLQDAKKTLIAHQIEHITIIRVPGALEIPFAAHLIAAEHDAIIALGAVIRGETPHFDYVCQGCIEGINRVVHDTETPIAFGVLTTETIEQALARANGTKNDEQGAHQSQGGGAYAATVALRMVSLQRKLIQGKE